MRRPTSSNRAITEGRPRPTLRSLLRETRAEIRRIRSIVVTALFVAAVAVAGFATAGTATGQWRLVPILSGSMEPEIATGAVVIARPAPLESVREGDVIVYKIPVGDRHLTTHRVIEVVEAGAQPVIRTKGDANSAADPWTARLTGEAAWKVDGHVPYLGRAILLAHRPEVRTVALWATVALFLVAALVRLWRRASPARDDARALTAAAA